MRIDVYVSSLQIEDFGKPLHVGERISCELIGYWGGALGQEVQSLPSYQSREGSKLLRRTGLVEYAFCGEIRSVQTLQDYGGPGLAYQETLTDCGLPIILVSHGLVAVSAWNLDDPTHSEISVGRYLSGLTLLDARISFRYPHLIACPLQVEITSISALDLFPSSRALGGVRPWDSTEAEGVTRPLILGLET